MSTQIDAFNLELLLLDKDSVKNITPVTVLDIFEGSSKNFHNDGLFSTTIFGRVGDERRNKTFSVIKLNIPILHPHLMKKLCDLKELYGGIMSGEKFAVFDEKLKDFVASDAITGKTGYSFFMSKYDKIVFEQRESSKREFSIKLVEKYRKKPTTDYLVVMPAGLRDYLIDSNGRPTEDEINKLYRTVLSISSMIGNARVEGNEEFFDKTRYSLQKAINDIYNYIMEILDGKEGFILSKWAARKIYHSTRNVLSSVLPKPTSFSSPNIIGDNETAVGIYQLLRSSLPLSVSKVRDKYGTKVFTGPNTPAVLVNRKTLMREMVTVDPLYYDKWMTYDGLEKIFASFGQEDMRHDEITIGDYYYGLVYVNSEKKVFRFLQSIDEVPEGLDKGNVRPITYAELLYMSIYDDCHRYPAFIVRYPVSGSGNIYPSYPYLISTVNSEQLIELDDHWQPTNLLAKEFPIRDGKFFNTIAPAISHLSGLNADFDGDTGSFVQVFSDEAVKEIDDKLNSRNYYVSMSGDLMFSFDDKGAVGIVLKNMCI